MNSKYLNKKFLEREANDIILNIINKYTNKEGFIVEKGDVLTGNVNKRNIIIEDLGDYIPFINQLGYKNFSSKQIKLTISFLEKRNYVYKKNKVLIRPYYNTDLILGFLEYYQQTKNQESLNAAKKIIQSWHKYFIKNNFVSAAYLNKINLNLPLTCSQGGGMYIELLSDLFKITKEKKYLALAKRLTDGWVNCPFFKNYGLFPNYHLFSFKILKLFPDIKKRITNATLHKQNTNLIFSLLSLYLMTKNKDIKKALYKWFGSVKENLLTKEGGLYTNWNPIEKGKNINLTNFHALEVFSDSSYFLMDKDLLSTAIKIGDFWIKQQSKETGLFPLWTKSPKGQESKSKPKNTSWLDCNTDMIIALMKLYELTRNKRYKESAELALEGVFKYHKKKYGYAKIVDYTNGKVIDPEFQTKTVTLFLKAIILFLNKEKNIYKTNWLYKLLRDR